jgi:hypothetical protein
MLAVATCGWLIERQQRASAIGNGSGRIRRATTTFYLECNVPEAAGLEAAATTASSMLCAIEAEALLV